MITPSDDQTTDAPAVRPPSGQHQPLAAIPAPSPIAGLEPLTRRTLRRLAWLSLRNASASLSITAAVGVTACSLAIGSAFIAGQNGAADPIAVAAIATPIGLVAFVFIVWFFLAGEIRGWARGGGWVVGYFTADSSQLVHPDSGDWVLTDHYTAHRGGGEAGPFRRQVFARLAAEADLHQVVIRFDTKVRRLVDIYLQDMPGLELIDTRQGRLTPCTSSSGRRVPSQVDEVNRGDGAGLGWAVLRGSGVALGNSVDGDRAARADEPYHASGRSSMVWRGDGGMGVE